MGMEQPYDKNKLISHRHYLKGELKSKKLLKAKTIYCSINEVRRTSNGAPMERKRS
jgi:hypothetical protein